MPAYYVELLRCCDWQGCLKPGTCEVRNTRNAEMGRFCRKHAEAKVAELNASEAEPQGQPVTADPIIGTTPANLGRP